MKITTLIEDTESENRNLKFEHGLSMFMECGNCNILFDTGQSGSITENAEMLNIDLNKTDILVLSHGHYDHCGGVKKLLETYDVKPKLIVGKGFFERCSKYRNYTEEEKSKLSNCSEYKYIGIDFERKYLEDKNIEIIETEDSGVMKIAENVFVFSNFEKYYDFEKTGSSMKYLKDGQYITDDFKDEVCMGIKTPDGLVVFLGCAHPGFLNIVKTIEKRTGEKIVGIIGGTHLIKADEGRINKSVEVLKTMDLKIIGLSHCSGENALNVLKNEYDDLFINRTGKTLELKLK